MYVYGLPSYQISHCNVSLVIIIKPKAKENVRTAIYVSYGTLQTCYQNRGAYFPKIYYQT
jgi:hypothetical protein